jgi:hypothetical protein
MVAFDVGKTPFNYALDHPHDGWRTTLAFAVDLYKNNVATITQEGVEFWYRRVYRGDCNDGGTTGNTASQVQMEFKASALVMDEVFFSALLTEEAEVQVVIGGSAYRGSWRNKPEGGAGLYHGSVPFDGREGNVEIRLTRGGKAVMSLTGPDISRNCGEGGYHNFNPYTGGKLMAAPRSVAVPSLSGQKCIAGWGANDFSRLCEFTCSYAYCPPGACVCSALGTKFEYPDGSGPPGFPLEGRGSSHAGLCSSACSLGFCPEEACGTTQYPLVEPMVSPFQPPACTSGTGDGDSAALCSFICRHGYCPIAACTCQGSANSTGSIPPSIPSFAQSRTTDTAFVPSPAHVVIVPTNACRVLVAKRAKRTTAAAMWSWLISTRPASATTSALISKPTSTSLDTPRLAARATSVSAGM